MALEKKRMQQRYGSFAAFKNYQQNLLPNEFASVTSGDPNTTSGKALYYAFGPGDTRRLMTAQDAEGIIGNAVKKATSVAEQAAETSQELYNQIQPSVEKGLQQISAAEETAVKKLTNIPTVNNHVIVFVAPE